MAHMRPDGRHSMSPQIAMFQRLPLYRPLRAVAWPNMLLSNKRDRRLTDWYDLQELSPQAQLTDNCGR